MELLALEDLKDYTQQEVKEHLAKYYSEECYRDTPCENILKQLEDKDFLIAYESVGSWGCDSSSYFLTKDKNSAKLFEIHGSHCSCHGFENQFDLEEMTVDAIKLRLSKNGQVFYCGGYDNDGYNNQLKAKEFILKL